MRLTVRGMGMAAGALLSLVAVHGCGGPSTPAGEVPRDAVEVVQVVGSEDQFGQIHDYMVRDEVLVLIDGLPIGSGSESRDQLLVVRRSTEKTFASAGRLGEGPGELMRPLALARDAVNLDLVWVWDQGNARLTAFDAVTWSRVPVAEVIVTGPSVFRFAWLTPDRLVGSVLSADALLAFYDLAPAGATARLGTRIGSGPFESAAESMRLHLNRNVFAMAPDGSRFVTVFLYSDDLHVYGAAGSVLVRTNGPVPVEPVLRTVSTGTGAAGVHLPETQLAYIAVDATEGLIYALFSGRRWGDYPLSRLGNGREVHVFDWDGRLVGVADLEEEVSLLKVDPKTGHLFGLRNDPYPAILEFQAPSFADAWSVAHSVLAAARKRV